ncbi:hypothetical protein ACFLX2_00545 [Candidatus Dependentiae bacterium]
MKKYLSVVAAAFLIVGADLAASHRGRGDGDSEQERQVDTGLRTGTFVRRRGVFEQGVGGEAARGRVHRHAPGGPRGARAIGLKQQRRERRRLRRQRKERRHRRRERGRGRRGPRGSQPDRFRGVSDLRRAPAPPLPNAMGDEQEGPLGGRGPGPSPMDKVRLFGCLDDEFGDEDGEPERDGSHDTVRFNLPMMRGKMAMFVAGMQRNAEEAAAEQERQRRLMAAKAEAGGMPAHPSRMGTMCMTSEEFQAAARKLAARQMGLRDGDVDGTLQEGPRLSWPRADEPRRLDQGRLAIFGAMFDQVRRDTPPDVRSSPDGGAPMSLNSGFVGEEPVPPDDPSLYSGGLLLPPGSHQAPDLPVAQAESAPSLDFAAQEEITLNGGDLPPLPDFAGPEGEAGYGEFGGYEGEGGYEDEQGGYGGDYGELGEQGTFGGGSDSPVLLLAAFQLPQGQAAANRFARPTVAAQVAARQFQAARQQDQGGGWFIGRLFNGLLEVFSFGSQPPETDE